MSGKYDITLKDLLINQPSRFLKLLTGFDKVKFLDIQLPEVIYRLSDFVMELEDKSIFQLEIQSTNDFEMLIRMYGYSYLILSKFKKLPKQTVLYVGDANLIMENKLESDDVRFSYTLMDIREIDSEELLKSDVIEDNILALLCKTDDDLKLIKEVLDKITKLDSEIKIRNYLKKIIEISHLRRFDTILLEEVKKMPITIDIKEHVLFKEGKIEGKKEGKIEGKKEAVLNLHKKLGLSKSKISEILDIDEEVVEEIISK